MQIPPGSFSSRRWRKQEVYEDADDVGAEDDADVGAAPSAEWRQRDDGGFGGEVEPMGEGAEEEV